MTQLELPFTADPYDLVYRLRLRAQIRRKIATRRSVQEGQPDRIADLLDEAANTIEQLQRNLKNHVYHTN